MSQILKRFFSADDFFVDSNTVVAKTLPLFSFTDRNFLDLELETVFRNSWICMPKQLLRRPFSGCRKESLLDILALRGNAARFEWLGESVFFKRDFEPKGAPALRCFLNRCPHAFYPLLLSETDESRSRFIQCQQHGLTAECDGSLRSHPGFKTLSNSDKECLRLVEYKMEEWNDFYFLCRGKPHWSFESVFSAIQESIGEFPISSLKYVPQAEERRVVAGNWKQHAWNYMDALHINWIHKGPAGLQDAIDMGSYKTELFEGASLQWAYAKNSADGFEPQSIHERFLDKRNPERRVFALWWFVFPNLTLNFYPWGLSVNVYMPVPGKPAETEFFWHHYVLDEAKYRNRDQQWLSAQVDDEDVDAMRRVGSNIQSGTFSSQRGVFSPLEAGPHWFHRTVFESIFQC